MTEKTRVVVCGALFGQVYLRAFGSPDGPLELAGIYARGSDRSKAVAAHHGVPLFTELDDIPDDVQLGAVVVRGGLLGGPGVEIAKGLMARGISVLQEHPLHHDELAGCLRAARQHGVAYHLNPFYTNVPHVRRYIGVVQNLLATHPPRYVDASCGFQVAYSLFDILGRCLGGVRPWVLGPPAPPAPGLAEATGLDVPFRSIDGAVAGVPLTLRIQNQMDPADPDNYAHLMHRVVIGTEAGALELVGTHGPIMWVPRPDFPRAVRDPAARPHFDYVDGSEALAAHLDVPSAGVLGDPAAPGYREIFEAVWPRGVAHALLRLRDDAAGDRRLTVQRGQYHLTLCRMWQEVTTLLGPAELLSAPAPRLLPPGRVDELAAAAVSEPA